MGRGLLLGFTGHEYLNYFNLYNMNGRMYDPLVGRFLSSDPKAILGVQLSLISVTLLSYKWDDGTSVQTIKLQNDEYESLSRIDLTIGLRFCK